MEKKTNVLFKELLSRLHTSVFKPMGYKKDGSNFRLYQPDGLCKIVNFQKSAFNPWFECSFTINVGVYYEDGEVLQNPKFKEHECRHGNRAGCISPRYGKDTWWAISEINETDMDALFEELKQLILMDIFPWFEKYPSKHAILEERKKKYGYTPGKI